MEKTGWRQGGYCLGDSTQSTLKRQMVLLGHCTTTQESSSHRRDNISSYSKQKIITHVRDLQMPSYPGL